MEIKSYEKNENGDYDYGNFNEDGTINTTFGSLKTIEELLESTFAKNISNIMSKKDIMSYHNQKAMPFYNLNGKICYKIQEVQSWARINLLSFNKGKDLIPNFYVCGVKEQKAENIPYELSKHSNNLWELPTDLSPCVYFLIDGVDIVYVGQSKNLPQRIQDHKQTKKFTRVIYMIVSINKLDEVEQFYEKELLPKYNNAHYVKKLKKERKWHTQANKKVIDLKDKLLSYAGYGR